MTESLARVEAKQALQAQREAMRDREATVKNLQWSGKLSKQEKAVLYHATKAYGLDPAFREVMVLGGNLYVTVAGLVRTASDSGLYGGNSFEELEPRVKEEVRYRCVVRKRVCSEWCLFEGLGRANANKLNKVTRDFADEMAQTRALGRALRRAWPISLCTFEELSGSQRAEARVVTPELLEEVASDPEIVNQETGELVDEPPLPEREPGEEG